LRPNLITNAAATQQETGLTRVKTGEESSNQTQDRSVEKISGKISRKERVLRRAKRKTTGSPDRRECQVNQSIF